MTIDPNGAFAEFSKNKGWAEPPIFVDEAFIEELRLGYETVEPKAVERLIKALETTYFGSEFGTLVAPSSAYSIQYLKSDNEIVLMRFFLGTVQATEAEGKDWLNLLKDVMNDELVVADHEIAKRVWDSYLDPTKREHESGFVNLASVENRAMAWGVPPDFIEIVVSSRPECEFLPVRGWLARQLCP